MRRTFVPGRYRFGVVAGDVQGVGVLVAVLWGDSVQDPSQMAGGIEQGHDGDVLASRHGQNLVHVGLGQPGGLRVGTICIAAQGGGQINGLFLAGLGHKGDEHVVQREAEALVVGEVQLQLVVPGGGHLMDQGDDPLLGKVFAAAVQVQDLMAEAVLHTADRSGRCLYGLQLVKHLIHRNFRAGRGGGGGGDLRARLRCRRGGDLGAHLRCRRGGTLWGSFRCGDRGLRLDGGRASPLVRQRAHGKHPKQHHQAQQHGDEPGRALLHSSPHHKHPPLRTCPLHRQLRPRRRNAGARRRTTLARGRQA